VSREAGDGVEMSCGDWTGARGEGWRAEVAFFSSEEFLLEHDELGLEEMDDALIQHAVDNLFQMMLSTEPLRLVCLNGNGIPVFEQSSNGGSGRASKIINDSVTRIGEHLDKTMHGINRLDSIVDRMVARLEKKDHWLTPRIIHSHFYSNPKLSFTRML